MHDAGLDVNEEGDFAMDPPSPKAAVAARGGRGSRGGAIRAKAALKPKVASKSKVLVCTIKQHGPRMQQSPRY